MSEPTLAERTPDRSAPTRAVAPVAPPALIDAVQEATAACFDAIFGCAPVFHGLEHAARAASAAEAAAETLPTIGGRISFSGNPQWLLILEASTEAAGALAQRFAEGIELDGDGVVDAIAELANVVAGDAKARLRDVGVATEFSVPQAHAGADVDALVRRASYLTRLRFSLPESPFWLTLAVLASPDHSPSEEECG